MNPISGSYSNADYGWIADILKDRGTLLNSVETERPKRVFETGIEDPVDAVDAAQLVAKAKGVACVARLNRSTMKWYVIEA